MIKYNFLSTMATQEPLLKLIQEAFDEIKLQSDRHEAIKTNFRELVADLPNHALGFAKQNCKSHYDRLIQNKVKIWVDENKRLQVTLPSGSSTGEDQKLYDCMRVSYTSLENYSLLQRKKIDEYEMSREICIQDCAKYANMDEYKECLKKCIVHHYDEVDKVKLDTIAKIKYMYGKV
jgi:hypothetical protein